MDALTYLALAAKAKLVFESPDTFISFPALSPVSYTEDQLKFGAFSSPDAAQRQIYSEFARLVNSLPTHTIFEMTETPLWDIYGSVLRSATLAHNQMTTDDTAAYEQAISFLSVAGSSGFPTASLQLMAYRQYRDAWFCAAQNYKSQQSTATSATDPAAVTQWAAVDEPRLRALVDQARGDWETKGFKAQVEDAQQVAQRYAARSPELMWHAWSALFNPDIDLQTDPAQQQFAPTSFVPAEVFSQEWPTFSITGTEIAKLVAQAPDELKEVFAVDGAQPTIDALSFEYRSVALARSWFDHDVFRARFWQLPAGSEPLCDGGDPPQGIWPAYIVALVFMRNIRVTIHADHPAPPQPIRMLPALQSTAVRRPFVPPPLRLAPRPIGATPHLAPGVAGAPRPSLQISMRHVPPAQPTPPHLAVGMPVRSAPGPASVHVGPGGEDLRGRVTLQQPPPPPPEPLPSDPPSSTSVPVPKKDISILAFICRRLPKCPDPDPDLLWEVSRQT